MELYKGKGKATEPSSYRDIALCSVPGKAVGKLLRKRANKVMHAKSRKVLECHET